MRKAITLGTISAMIVALAMVGCDRPAQSERSTAEAPAAAETAAHVAAGLETLNISSPIPDATWFMIEGLTAQPLDEPAKVAGQKAVQLSATPTGGLHRIGLKFSGKAAPTDVKVTIWLRSTPGVSASIEAAGVTMARMDRPADYGIGFVDLASGALEQNVLVTNETGLKDLAIQPDGEWRRITFPFRSHDKDIYVNINAVVKGNQLFVGAPQRQFLIGGIKVSPAS